MTLQEAISQLVELGEFDPSTIAEKVRGRYDEKWLASELLALADDIVQDIARQELGRIRRSREVAIRPGDAMSSAEMKVAKAWVPKSGWKKAADLTEDDLLARAAWYDQFADASRRRADWCRQVAELMRSERAKCLGDLRADLLPLLAVLESVSA